VTKPFEILLIEDNRADARLFIECLKDARSPVRVHVEGNGDAALAYLGRSGGEPPPDLVLLDLNLPGMTGPELLGAIKGDPRWSAIPVVVLTSSQSASDVRDVLERRADGFLSKPIELSGYDRIVRTIEAYWMPRPGAGEVAGGEAAGEAGGEGGKT
jgi:CheY-like chemotaxis protein